MSLPDTTPLRAVAEVLDRSGMDYVFVGGAIVNLLLDHPELSPARPTYDIDVILQAVTAHRYAEVEHRLRTIGFDHDMRRTRSVSTSATR